MPVFLKQELRTTATLSRLVDISVPLLWTLIAPTKRYCPVFLVYSLYENGQEFLDTQYELFLTLNMEPQINISSRVAPDIQYPAKELYRIFLFFRKKCAFNLVFNKSAYRSDIYWYNFIWSKLFLIFNSFSSRISGKWNWIPDIKEGRISGTTLISGVEASTSTSTRYYCYRSCEVFLFLLNEPNI